MSSTRAPVPKTGSPSGGRDANIVGRCGPTEGERDSAGKTRASAAVAVYYSSYLVWHSRPSFCWQVHTAGFHGQESGRTNISWNGTSLKVPPTGPRVSHVRNLSFFVVTPRGRARPLPFVFERECSAWPCLSASSFIALSGDIASLPRFFLLFFHKQGKCLPALKFGTRA